MRTEDHFVEKPLQPTSGWAALFLLPLLLAGVIVTAGLAGLREGAIAAVVIPSVLCALVTLCGFYVVSPNASRVLVLFGTYRGTVRQQGLFWTNPFTIKRNVSLKANNVASDTIKVNDLGGNPIEIGAVVVWRVRDPAQALFDVEDYAEYVDIQIEAAVRQLASTHPYDEPIAGSGQETGDEPHVVSLRGDSAIVAEELQGALDERLRRAGIEVIESRLSHLAYAPEIASAMLQRQQAEAIISARQKIVEGAVGMVEQALDDLGSRGVVDLDDERKATLVGNLLVILCGQSNPQPVVNVGGLYN